MESRISLRRIAAASAVTLVGAILGGFVPQSLAQAVQEDNQDRADARRDRVQRAELERDADDERGLEPRPIDRRRIRSGEPDVPPPPVDDELRERRRAEGADAERRVRDPGRAELRERVDDVRRLSREELGETDRDDRPVRDAELREREPSARARARSSGRSTDLDVRLESLRGADLGLWFSRSGADGLVISDVAPAGTVAQYGFLEGDRIVSVNGLRVTDEPEFIQYLFAEDVVNDRVPVVVTRGGRRRIVYVEPSTLLASLERTTFDPLARFGVVLDDRYYDRIVVWRVLPRTPAFYAGLRRGDVITSFDGQSVVDAGDFVRLIQSAEPAEISLQISRNQQLRDLEVDLTEFEIVETAPLPEPALDVRVRTDIRSVDRSTDRRLRPRPDVRPGELVPGGEIGRDDGPVTPSTYQGGSPTAPLTPGFPR